MKTLRVGESILIPTPTDATVKARGEKVLLIEEFGPNLKVTARAVGHATINIGAKTFEIEIRPNSKQSFRTAVADLLSNRLGLNLSPTNSTPTVEGHLYRISDYEDLVQLAEKFDEPFRFDAIPDKEVALELRQFVLVKLRGRNLPAVLLRFGKDSGAEANVKLPAIEKRLRRELQKLGFELQASESLLQIQPLVRVHIVVAELSRNLQHEFGIDWPTSATAEIAPKFVAPKALAVTLRALEQKGLAQVLASPSLLARSGSRAEFLAGGEFGIRLSTSKQREVIWKRHGILLEIKPNADFSGRLSIELTTEVSLLDAGQSVDGIPALKTHRMSTHFDLSEPSTIVLSGLIRNEWGRSAGQVPVLGDIPILGKLFRSENFNQMRSELVIFVTPEIVSGSPPAQTGDPTSLSTGILPKGWQNEP